MAAINLRRLLAVKNNIIRLLLLKRRQKRLNRYKKRFSVRQIYAERKQKGEYHLLVKELMLHDQEYFFNCFRMSPTTFEQLLSWIGPLLQRATTKMREPIGPSERLCVCLRYLVTGDAQVTIAASYRISAAVVGRIINETCELLWNTLIEKGYVKHPSTENEWKVIAEEFETCWNFPHCVGAIDGKHVLMQAPGNSGSAYFNYKKTFSIVLMAVCNAKYKFTLVDIGDIGRQSDGSVYGCSHLGYAIENNLLNIPSESKLTNSEKVLPYVFIGDDAFGLKIHMMKPFPSQNLPLDQRVFNYRLSRARRVIENTFGIAASRFRIFRKPIIANVEKVILVTKAVVALHNFLMTINSSRDNYKYCPRTFMDEDGPSGLRAGEWRKDRNAVLGLQPISRTGSNNYSRDAASVRQGFKDYFVFEGAVEWQWELVSRTVIPYDAFLDRLTQPM
ncbi:Hypothetical predicted protein [Paramuricea clavata]|uniref:Uncharacterized protein n=1 Tax=Paramuricea clavata TaxID=317549 RepID=A0A6S7KTG8_PARCT|nr:Hypothetical predicted protein [Paramuricea clavata]